MNRTFPDGFIWGAASAAHQIEGNNVNSDWWELEHRPETPVAEPSGDACDSYHRYPEDIRIVAELGLGMYRFSLEWARIEPERGFVSRAELDHYRRMIDTARDQGVTPMVTLHHFTVPRWFAHAGGWRANDAVERFTRYVETVSAILDDVEWVGTINEPNMVAITAGADAGDAAGSQWESTHGLPNPSRRVSEVLAAAHRSARSVLSGLGHVRSGWTVATQAVQAAPGESGAQEAAQAYSYPRDAWFLEQAAGDDWVGVQAYTRTIVGPEGPRPVADGVERTLTGWEYYPPALAEGVRLAARYAPGVPVFVTENGMATGDDARRRDYVRGALEGLQDTMQEGTEVLGYLYWSLLDNYEWGSFAPTFGIVGVDRATFARDVRESARWLGRVAQANALVD